MKHNVITVWTNTIFLFYQPQKRHTIQKNRNKKNTEKLINNIKHLETSRFDTEDILFIILL